MGTVNTHLSTVRGSKGVPAETSWLVNVEMTFVLSSSRMLLIEVFDKVCKHPSYVPTNTLA